MKTEDESVAIIDGLTAETALTSDDIYKVQRAARWKKSSSWLSTPLTGNTLACAAVIFSWCTHMLGKFFNAATKEGSLWDSSVMPFLVAATNPIVSTMQKMVDMLEDQDSPEWAPLIAMAGGFTPQMYSWVCDSMISAMGNFCLRLRDPFEDFPWVIGRLVHPNVSEEDLVLRRVSEWLVRDSRLSIPQAISFQSQHDSSHMIS